MDHLHQESKVNIGPVTGEFTPGFQIEGHARFGAEYDNEVAPMADECKNAALCFGIKLTLTNESVGPQAVETLTQLKEMASGIEQVQEALSKGLTIDFRHEGLNVFINVVVPETLPELQAIPGFTNISLAGTNYSGKTDWKVTSGVDPTKFLTASIDEIVEMAANFSVEGNGNFEELHHVLTVGADLVKGIIPSSKEVNMAIAAAQILTAFRSLSLEFKYDPTVIRSVIKGLIEGSGKGEKVNEKLGQNQEMANQFLPQAQMMAPMFIGPYADLLKNVNLGHYEVFIMVPRLRLYLRPGFSLFGLNSFINEKFLSQ